MPEAADPPPLEPDVPPEPEELDPLELGNRLEDCAATIPGKSSTIAMMNRFLISPPRIENAICPKNSSTNWSCLAPADCPLTWLPKQAISDLTVFWLLQTGQKVEIAETPPAPPETNRRLKRLQFRNRQTIWASTTWISS